MGATDRTVINGVRSYTGSASLYYYQESSSNVRLLTQSTFNVFNGGEDVTSDTYGENTKPVLSYLTLGTYDGSKAYDMHLYAYITGLTITCAVGEVLSADITFEGHGAPGKQELIT